jgi:predicted glycosyltransferase involved in capsule biosynthesis
MTTRVVNVRNYKPYNKYWYNQPADSQYVYIGRYVPYLIPINAKWRNPFPIDKHAPNEDKERQRVLIRFREYLTNEHELLKQIPIELKDKTLGCWCKPEACQGDILAEIADGSN